MKHPKDMSHKELDSILYSPDLLKGMAFSTMHHLLSKSQSDKARTLMTFLEIPIDEEEQASIEFYFARAISKGRLELK